VLDGRGRIDFYHEEREKERVKQDEREEGNYIPETENRRQVS